MRTYWVFIFFEASGTMKGEKNHSQIQCQMWSSVDYLPRSRSSGTAIYMRGMSWGPSLPGTRILTPNICPNSRWNKISIRRDPSPRRVYAYLLHLPHGWRKRLSALRVFDDYPFHVPPSPYQKKNTKFPSFLVEVRNGYYHQLATWGSTINIYREMILASGEFLLLYRSRSM